MNFSSTDLLPELPRSTEKSAVFRLPLTPFFIDAATRANQRTRGFHGDDFFLQNKRTRHFDDEGELTDEPICGFAAYRQSDSEDRDDGTWTGSLVRSYVFDTEENEVRVETEETGTHAIGTTHSRTATVSQQGFAFNDPPDHTTITLSAEVEKGWLAGQLDAWRSEDEEFRDATGNGLGMYSFIGQGATRTESDGYLASVGGGDAVALPHVFAGTPIGMTGDEGELWNGNFHAWVRKVTRMNEPVVHREESDNRSRSINMRVGYDIYRDGYAEVELSEPVSGWCDDYGTFDTGEELDDAPRIAALSWDLENLLNYLGDGKGHELTLVSRTGHRYRVTIEAGESDGQEWTTHATHTLVTDAQTLRVDFEFPDPGEADRLRVAKIEKLVDDEWEVVSDIANGDWPGEKIGPDPCGDFLLLAVVRRRSGQPWGFTEFKSPWTARYRKKTFRMHRNPGTVNLDTGSCGGGLSGSLDCEWTEEYDADTGLPKPRNVTQWTATANGTDWTPEEVPDSIFFGGSSVEVDTATKTRREGEHTWDGRFLVAFDAPDPGGKVISESWENLPVSFADGENLAAPADLDPPASGHSVFFGGYRLGYP